MGCMTPDNALAIAVSIETGLRVGDVLALRGENLHNDYIQYIAEKTKKPGIAPCAPSLIAQLRERAARTGYCFPSRWGSKNLHRSRQAVWKNVRKAAVASGIKPHVSPHSARKTFAVDLYHKHGIEAVKAALQHGDTLTTNLYALADLQGATYDRDRLVHDVSDEVMSRLASLMRLQGVNIDALNAAVAETKKPASPLNFIVGEDELK